MTVYVLGGSSTAMTGGWTDSFATQIMRRHAVRNLAIGAGNTLMALVRLTREVDLKPGDTVICASAIRDAMCLTLGHFQDGALLRYTEEVIRRCADAEARFIPLFMDTIGRDLDIRQRDHKTALTELFQAYDLDWIDVTVAYQNETGQSRIPVAYYDLTGHIAPHSEMTLFIADLVADAVLSDPTPPKPRTPVICDPARQIRIIDRFAPDDRAAGYVNRVLSDVLWEPELTLTPAAGIKEDSQLVAMVILADPAGGAFDVRVGDTAFTLSATCLLLNRPAPMALTVYLPNVLPNAPRMTPETELSLRWAEGRGAILADNLFREGVDIPDLGPTRSRLQCLVLDEPADTA